MKTRGTIGQCKDCGKRFPLADTARRMDIARGLSAPERCPDCRKRRRQEIKSKGAIFVEPPKETDDSKRCWGKFGLGYIKRPPLDRIPLPDNAVPTNLPLQWPKNAEGITDEHDRKIAEQFSRIAPATEALVTNLEDPNGARVSILVGPTGTGKSTWVPYRILRSKIGEEGRICVTQPRLVTLKRPSGKKYRLEEDVTTPGYIARELLRATGVGAGYEVGYQHSGEYEQQDRYTKLLYVTDGTLINWLKDGRVGDFDVVFVDEAHEQSANMEQIFALLKYRLPLYPRLKVVIASATVDVEKFRNYFGDGNSEAVFLAAPDKAAAVTPHTIYDRTLEEWVEQLPQLSSLKSVMEAKGLRTQLHEATPELVKAIREDSGFAKLGEPNGDILVFVPTIATVNTVAKALKRQIDDDPQRNDNVVVSHAQATQKQLEAFKRSEAQAQRAKADGATTKPPRIIVATNYAETSVTMENVRYVIDSGLIMQPEWKPQTRSKSYQTKWHSKAGYTQRKGRVGRTQSGEYFRLYSEHVYECQMAEETPPALTREPLDDFLLSAKAAGIEQLQSFQWMSRGTDADDVEFNRSLNAISTRGGLDGDGDITTYGLELGSLRTTHVELADCLALADRFACAVEVATFLAFVGQMRSPFSGDEDRLLQYARWRHGCHDDLEFSLRLFYHWWNTPANARKAWAEREGLSSEFFAGVKKQRESHLASLQRRDAKRADRALDLNRLSRVRLIFARSLRDSVYIENPDNPSAYQPYDPHPESPPVLVRIDQDSACRAAPVLGAFVCLERVERGERIFAKHIVRIDPTWLPGLHELGAVGMSRLLQDHVRAEHDGRVAATARAITTLPTLPTFNSFHVGQEVQLRMLRPHPSDHSLWLSEDVVNGSPVLFEKKRSRFEAGDVLRASVVTVARKPDRVTANQDAQFADYVPHSPVASGQVVQVQEYADTGRLRSVVLEVEPGIHGYVPKSHLFDGGYDFTLCGFDPCVGAQIPVIVSDRTTESRIVIYDPHAYRDKWPDKIHDIRLLLQAPNPRLQQGAAMNLVQLGELSDRVLQILVESARSSQPAIRCGAAIALEQFGPRSVRVLKSLLSDRRAFVRAHAMISLSNLSDHHPEFNELAISACLEARADLSAEMRDVATGAMFGNLAGPNLPTNQLTGWLIDALADPAISQRAQDELVDTAFRDDGEQLWRDNVLPALDKVLRNSTSSTRLKSNVAVVLGVLGDADYVSPRYYWKPKNAGSWRTDTLRNTMPQLRELLLAEDRDLRANALFALSELARDYDDCDVPLEDLIREDESPAVRAAAVRVLRVIGKREPIEKRELPDEVKLSALIAAEDHCPDVREEARLLLCWSGDYRLMPEKVSQPLATILNDQSSEAAITEAVKTLGTLGIVPPAAGLRLLYLLSLGTHDATAIETTLAAVDLERSVAESDIGPSKSMQTLIGYLKNAAIGWYASQDLLVLEAALARLGPPMCKELARALTGYCSDYYGRWRSLDNHGIHDFNAFSLSVVRVLRMCGPSVHSHMQTIQREFEILRILGDSNMSSVSSKVLIEVSGKAPFYFTIAYRHPRKILERLFLMITSWLFSLLLGLVSFLFLLLLFCLAILAVLLLLGYLVSFT